MTEPLCLGGRVGGKRSLGERRLDALLLRQRAREREVLRDQVEREQRLVA